MTRVLYNGEYIELKDELEPGYKELDSLTNKKDEENKNESPQINLEDTKEFDLGDLNE